MDKEYVADQYDHIITHAVWGLIELGFLDSATQYEINKLIKRDFNKNGIKRK